MNFFSTKSNYFLRFCNFVTKVVNNAELSKIGDDKVLVF